MADNFAATPGSGATFGMDEVVDGTLGTVKVGFGKIMDGTLDSTNKLIVNSSGEALVKNTTGDTSLASIDGKITAVNTGAVVVSSSALPTGASTAAKQPAIGTAGTASADVITVQGKALMTPILTDGSATTQPVSGTVTADTELPAAAALADTTANPTVPGVGTYLMGWDGTGAVWDRLKQQGLNADAQTAHAKGVLETVSNGYVFNGTTWDRTRGDATNGAFVNVKTSVLPTGAATSALQTQPGVDIGDVTINNAAGAAAVNIQDGGNSITVDGTVTTSGTVTEANSAAILTSTQLLDDTVATLGTTTYTEATTKANIIGAVRRDADTTLVDTTNEVAPLQVNAGGQLKTAVISSALPTGAATSALQTTQDTSINTLLKPASTLTAVTTVGTVTNLSQQSGVAISIGTGVRDAGTQRVTIATNDVVPITDNSGSLTVDAPVGTPAFVRLSDGAAAITTLPVSLASVPSHAVTNAGTFVTQLNDGTNTANTLKSDTTAAGQNSLMIAGAYLSTAFTTTTVQAVGTTDAGNYSSVSVHVVAQGTTSSITFQSSNDNTNWISHALTSAASTGTMVSVTTAASSIYYGALKGRYFRLNVTGISAGTTSGIIVFQTQPKTSDAVNASQTGTWTVQPGNTANTTAWKVDSASIASTTSGYTPNKLISAATTNATSIKGSAGTLGFVSATNINAAARYLKFYNKATAPTVGTDVPLLVYLIPGNTAGAGTNIGLPSEGANFTTGIAFAITTGAADSDTGAVAANEIIINYGTI